MEDTAPPDRPDPAVIKEEEKDGGGGGEGAEVKEFEEVLIKVEVTEDYISAKEEDARAAGEIGEGVCAVPVGEADFYGDDGAPDESITGNSLEDHRVLSDRRHNERSQLAGSNNGRLARQKKMSSRKRRHATSSDDDTEYSDPVGPSRDCLRLSDRDPLTFDEGNALSDDAPGVLSDESELITLSDDGVDSTRRKTSSSNESKCDGGNTKRRKDRMDRLTVAQRTAALELFDKGVPQHVVAQQYGVSPSAVWQWRKNRDKTTAFCNSFSSYRVKRADESWRARTTKTAFLDDLVFKWFQGERALNGTPITGPMIKQRALAIHTTLETDISFKASDGWLSRFKQRFGIRLSVAGKGPAVDEAGKGNRPKSSFRWTNDVSSSGCFSSRSKTLGVSCPRKVCYRPSSGNANFSSLDNVLYCDNCTKEYEGDCPLHGPLLIVEDTPVPVDESGQSRAKKTAPPPIDVVDSHADDTKCGVYARMVIPARTRFGPYEGRRVPLEACTTYSWMVLGNGKPDHCVDGSDLSTANWMRYVNCARKKSERNVDAFQFNGKIYYRTICSLAPRDELLVWGGDEFSEQRREYSRDGSKAAVTLGDEIQPGAKRKLQDSDRELTAPAKTPILSRRPTASAQLSTTQPHSAPAGFITPDIDAPGEENIIEHLLNGSFEIGLAESDNLLLLPFSLLQGRDGMHEDTGGSHAPMAGGIADDANDPGKAKRPSNPSRWKTNLAKLAVQTGAEHFSAAGNLIKKRQLQPSCKPSCRFQCSQRVEESFRVEIFNYFWSITNQTDKWDFISKHVKVNEKKSNTANVTRRKSSRQYFFHIDGKDVKVCKTMFVSTLDICDGVVETVARKVMSNGCVTPDKRGSNNKRTGVHQHIKNSAAEHINSFPRVPSHYLKAVTSKEYLEEGLTVKKMHDLYLDWMRENYPQEKPATERQYRDVFNSEFDIAFFAPFKEKCDLCHQWESSKPEDKVVLIEKHTDHIGLLTKQRELFKNDSDTASKLKTTFCLASFDFHKVFHIPKAQSTIFHYKSKLAMYNFTVYDLIRHDGFCYVYDESTGHKGSNEAASFLFNFITDQAHLGITTFRFYTNNCTAENKNLFVFSMMLLAAAKYRVNIAVRYLQEGHSQTEGDAVQSRIEKTVRNIDIFSPPQWYQQIRESKKTNPYHAIEITQEDIFDFGDLVDKLSFTIDSSGSTLPVSQLRDVFVDGDNIGVLKYKLSFEEEYRMISTLTDDHVDLETYGLERAYSAKFGIDPAKLEDFLSLCESNDIPGEDHHAFYHTLVAAPENE